MLVPDSGAIRSYPLIDARSGEPSQFANNCSRDIHPHPKTIWVLRGLQSNFAIRALEHANGREIVCRRELGSESF